MFHFHIKLITGSVHQQGLESRPAVFSTQEGSKNDDDSYIGYSTVVGKFQANAEYDGIVVGMPRGASLYGKVIVHIVFPFFHLLFNKRSR